MASRRPVHLWLFAALLWVTPAACLFTPEVPDGPCKADESVCDDDNPCTNDVCGSDGYCTNEADDTLIPDDLESCTNDACVGGNEQHTSVPDGTSCGAANALMCEGGKCKCEVASECGEETLCLKYACIDQACEPKPEAQGKPVNGAEDFDCKQNVCDGNGGVSLIADTADVPPDPIEGDCQTKACGDDGQIVNEPDVNDLPEAGLAGDCKKRVCTAGGMVADEIDMTDAPSDTSSEDCKKPACTAAGEVVDVEDATDAPVDDSNPCTMEGCDGPDPINHVAVTDGTSCGAPAACGPSGPGFAETTAETCQSGVCEPAMSTSCGFYKCNGAVCHMSCTDINQCAPGTTCQGNACKPTIGNGTPCNTNSECSSNLCIDGVCCNSTCMGVCQSCAVPGALGVCTAIPAGADPGNECSDPQVCDGSGACKKPQSETCANNGECLSGQCEDGYCCNVDCPGACATCNQAGSEGSCLPVPLGQTATGCSGGSACGGDGTCKLVNGQSCTQASQCLSGFCPYEDGDGRYCCDDGCTGLCESCRSDKTDAANGVCAPISDKSDPDAECSGMCMNNGSGCCNGMGACY